MPDDMKCARDVNIHQCSELFRMNVPQLSAAIHQSRVVHQQVGRTFGQHRLCPCGDLGVVRYVDNVERVRRVAFAEFGDRLGIGGAAPYGVTTLYELIEHRSAESATDACDYDTT